MFERLRSSRRYPDRAGTTASRLLRTLVPVLFVSSAIVFAVQTGAYTTLSADRGSQVDLAGDDAALVGLDIASSVTEGSKDRMVTLTNNLGETATVEVALGDPTLGALWANGQQSTTGSISFSLAPGASTDVYLDATLDDASEDSSDCSSPEATTTIEGFEIAFYCASYDGDEDETTYKYRVTGVGEDSPQYKDLSHVVFGVPSAFEDDDVEDTSPEDSAEVKIESADPTTGVRGVKFDETVDKVDGSKVFTYTLEGHHGTGTVDVGVKAGPGSTVGQLTGPSYGADGSSSSQAFTFSITVSTTYETVTLERGSTVEPAPRTPTPTPEPTETPSDDSGDDGDADGSDGDDDSGDDGDDDSDGGGPPDDTGPPGDGGPGGGDDD